MSMKECIEDIVECALEAKEDLGLEISKVSFLTREWEGESVGRGRAYDTVEPIKPNPTVIEYKHDFRIKEGGWVKNGDVLVKSILRKNYPEENMVNGYSPNDRTEKFFLIDDKIYNVISVEKKIATWEVLCRRTSDQERYHG